MSVLRPLAAGTVLSSAAVAGLAAQDRGRAGVPSLSVRHPLARTWRWQGRRSGTAGSCSPGRADLRGVPVRVGAAGCAHRDQGGNGNADRETLACEAGRRLGARLMPRGLAVLAVATFFVSFRAQYTFMYAVKHQVCPALIEALIADVAMVVCALLALGMACAGQSAKVARLLVVVFAGLSAGMNYLAADVTSFRSVAVYVMPPAVFAVCTDQVVSVIRRHGLGITEDSAWAVLGRSAVAAARLAGIILLYSLRLRPGPGRDRQGPAEDGPGARRSHPAAGTRQAAPGAFPGTAPETVPEVLPRPVLEAVPGAPGTAPAGKQPGPATPERLAEFYAADLAAGGCPSKRQIKREWPVGFDAASELHEHLAAAWPLPDTSSPAWRQPPRRPPGRGHRLDPRKEARHSSPYPPWPLPRVRRFRRIRRSRGGAPGGPRPPQPDRRGRAGEGCRRGDRLRAGPARQALRVGRHRPGRVRLLRAGHGGVRLGRGQHRPDLAGAVGDRAACQRPGPGRSGVLRRRGRHCRPPRVMSAWWSTRRAT